MITDCKLKNLSPFPFLLVLFTIIWYFATSIFLRSLVLLQEKFHDFKKVEEINAVLTPLQAWTQPKNLAYERLLCLVRGIKRIDRETLKLIKSRVRTEFGKDLPGIVWTVRGRQILLFPINSTQLKEITHRAMAFFREEAWRDQDFNKIHLERNSRWKKPSWEFKRQNLFSITPYHLVNKHGKIVPGLIFLGIFSQSPKKSFAEINGKLAIDSAKKYSQAQCWGRVAIFLPNNVFKSKKWQRKAIRRKPEGFPFKIWIGTEKDFLSQKVFPNEVAFKIRKKFKGLVQSAFECFGWFIGMISIKEMPGYIAIVYDTPKFENRFTYFFAGGLSIASTILVLCFGLLLYSGQFQRILLPLRVKFFIFSMLAIVFPLTGLMWLILQQNLWKEKNLTESTYLKIDEKVKKLEMQNTLFQARLVSKIKIFLESFPWLKEFPKFETIKALVTKIFKQHFDCLGIFSEDVNSFILAKPPLELDFIEIKEKNKERTPAFSILHSLGQMQMNLVKIHHSIASKQEEKYKTQIALEALISLTGGFDQLLKIAVNQDILSTFRIMKETSWFFIHIMRKIDHTAKRVFFFVFHRKGYFEKEIMHYIAEGETQSRNFPPLCFYSHTLRNSIPYFPRDISDNFWIRLILEQIALEGGIQKLPLILNGRKAIAMARPFKDSDFSVMAIEPYPQLDLDFKHKIGWIIALLCYFFLLIFVLRELFQNWFLKSIETLNNGVIRIAKGDFEFKLPIFSNDEIGKLVTSFNKMSAGLKEKEYMARFVSDLTLQAVKRSGKTPAARIQATILFSDIRGFTTMSETMHPEAIVEMLNEYFTQMEEVIETHDGIIDKFIGDAIMAVFLPRYGRAHPAERAVKAGLAMIAKTDEFNLRRKKEGKFEITNGVGIATGELLMGVLGRSSGRQDFTVTGVTVNIAAQMEKRTKQASLTRVVVCSETIKNLPINYRIRTLPKKENLFDGFEIIST